MKYILLLCFFLLSCTEENSETLSLDNQVDLSNVTYTSHVKNVIDSQCASCHGATNPSAGLNLSTYTLLKNNINSVINRIDLQTGEVGIMPPAGRMSETNIQIIKNWQTQGLTE